MTIASEITNYANGLGDAYTAVNDMGGIIPTDKNMNNLDDAIRTIPQSGPTPPTPTPLDPDTVYNNTRPSNWLDMPADADVEEETIYYLLDVPANRQQVLHVRYDIILGFSGSWKYDIEFGKMVNGSFVADPTYSMMDAAASSVTLDIPMSIFTTLSGGESKQVLMRVKTQDVPNHYLWNHKIDYNCAGFMNAVIEMKIRSSRLREFHMGTSGNYYGYEASSKLRYATLLDFGQLNSMYCGFNMNTSLIAVRGASALKPGDATNLFGYCYNLVAAPTLDLSGSGIMSNIFIQCTSLEVSPNLINTSSRTGTNNLYNGCKSLRSVPLFDMSNVTNAYQMFSGCSALEEIPQFVTSSLTSAEYMFADCSALKSIPLLDFSHVTNMSSTFSGCMGLKTIPALDTSSVTNMYYAFSSCTSLEKIPALNTSSCTNFYYMFYRCFSLKEVPSLDTSHATNVSYMFNECRSMKGTPDFDIHLATNFGGMFRNCFSLTSIDLSTWDFSKLSSSYNGQEFLYGAMFGNGCNIYLPDADKFSSTYGLSSNMFAAYGGNGSQSVADEWLNIKWIITDTNAMLPLTTNATNVFGSNSSSNVSKNCVYVPDSMYSTYTANSYWNSLGTRLKKLSELPS